MDIVNLLTLAISVVVLIMFIRLAVNVGHIRESLAQDEKHKHKERMLTNARVAYHTNRSLNRKEAAHEALVELVCIHVTDPSMTMTEKRQKVAELKKKYDFAINELGYPFPDNIVPAE